MNKENIITSTKIVVLSILIGIFSVVFAKSVNFTFEIFLKLEKILGYWLLVYIPLGFAGITFILQKYFPETEGSGIPQALSIKHIYDSEKLKKIFYPRLIISKFLAISCAELFGATIGREGATVQIGAAILSLSKKNPTLNQRKFLLKLGAAAGLGAAFNTPLGAIVFALEELFKHSTEKKVSFANILVIGIAGFTSVALVGNYTYFGTLSSTLLNYNLINIAILVLILGIITGTLAIIFTKIMFVLTLSPNSTYNKWRKKAPIHNALLCGFLAAVTGIISHGYSFGNGYHESFLALHDQQALPSYFAFAKMAGVIFSSSSGVPGGYFATSLSIGEGLGALVYSFLHIAPIEQYYLLGMVGFLSAITRAPLTSCFMVLQITLGMQFALPVMATALIATYIAHIFDKGMYHHQTRKLVRAE